MSNALSLWLSIEPPDVFLYVFLPPILVDSAVRLNFYIFRKVWVSLHGPVAAQWPPNSLSSGQEIAPWLCPRFQLDAASLLQARPFAA